MGFDQMRPKARQYDSWGFIGSKHRAPEQPAQPTRYKLGDCCATCGSAYPERHPAVSCEGEVSLCLDDFHLQPTPSNRPAYIEAVLKARREKGL